MNEVLSFPKTSGVSLIKNVNGNKKTFNNITEPTEQHHVATKKYVDSTNNIIDYTTLKICDMLSDIDNDKNKFYGKGAKYIAGEEIKNGRVLSLYNDDDDILKVCHIKLGTEIQESVVPLGISQNNANIGEEVTVCILGYTTVKSILATPDTKKGSQVQARGGGLIEINAHGINNEPRIGYLASKLNSSNNCLIYYDGWFENF